MGTWTAGRRRELRVIQQAVLGGERRGCLLVGEAGIGKSHLARTVAERAADRGLGMVWATCTPAAAPIPLAPFEAVVPSTGEDGGPSGNEADLTRVRRALLAARTAEGLVIVLDDSQHADDATVALLRGMVAVGDARLVLTARTVRNVPRGLAALWSGGALHRVDIGPLDGGGLAELAARVVGGALTPATVEELGARSGGNPLFATELVRAAVRRGLLRRSADGDVVLVGELTSSPALVDLVALRLAGLGAAARRVVELLALGEPLTLAWLESAADPAALGELEEEGLIRIDPDGTGSVRLSHPLYGEAVARGMAVTRRRERYRELLADMGSGAGDDGRGPDPVRVATWMIEAGTEVDAGTAVAAADRALGLSATDAAARLVAAAEHAGGCSGALARLRGQLAVQRGDPESAEASFREAEALVVGDEEARVAVLRARNALFGLRRPAHALRLLDDARGSAAAGSPREAELDAIEAQARMMLGEVRAAARLGDGAAARLGDASSVAGRADLASAVLTQVTATLAGMLVGEVERVGAPIARARAVAVDLEPHEEVLLARRQLAINAAYASAFAGDVRSGLSIVGSERAAAAAGGDRAMAAVMAVMASGLEQLAGDPAVAADLAATGVQELRTTDPLGLAGLGRCYEGLASALLGRVEVVASVLRDTAGSVPHDPRVAVHRARLSAWDRFLAGDMDEAVAKAIDAARIGQGSEHLVWAVLAAHDAVRFGRAEAVRPLLTTLVGGMEGRLLPLLSAHAEALDADDPDCLAAVAAGLRSAGACLYAAEALAQAAASYERQGRSEHARIVGREAVLAVPIDVGRVVTLAPMLASQRLTPREREVADLASQGASSRQIAEQLVVSVRTVDNHLSRVYAKLAVANRAELTALLLEDR